jgi:transposase
MATRTEAARDLDLHENVLRKWIRLYEEGPAHAFPGPGQQKPDDAEIQALKREVRKLRAERDILKKAAENSIGHCNTSASLSAGELKSSVFLGL